MDMNGKFQETIEKAAAFDAIAVEYARIAKLFEEGKISLNAVIKLSSVAGGLLDRRLRLAEDRETDKANAEYDSLVFDVIDAAEVLVTATDDRNIGNHSTTVPTDSFAKLVKVVRARLKAAGERDNEDAE